jgi:hypothetical protein
MAHRAWPFDKALLGKFGGIDTRSTGCGASPILGSCGTLR